MTDKNRLYCGDCLHLIREHLATESVDLIYLDPPFNSKRLYHADIDGAQWAAFNDTWRWTEAEADFEAATHDPRFTATMQGLQLVLGCGPSLAYLAYLACRLGECHRVLKPTGSLYLHCDPTMSHYLKVLLDALFCHAAPGQFINEIIWHYQTGGASKRRFARKHDCILVYGKSPDYRFFPEAVRVPRTEKALARAQNPKGARLAADDTHKLPMDVWADIQALNPNASERLGYPTQKPTALLERIVAASSRADDLVLDPFCGSGTTLSAAQRLGRRWIGMDLCDKASAVSAQRLQAGAT